MIDRVNERRLEDKEKEKYSNVKGVLLVWRDEEGSSKEREGGEGRVGRRVWNFLYIVDN